MAIKIPDFSTAVLVYQRVSNLVWRWFSSSKLSSSKYLYASLCSTATAQENTSPQLWPWGKWRNTPRWGWRNQSCSHTAQKPQHFTMPLSLRRRICWLPVAIRKQMRQIEICLAHLYSPSTFFLLCVLTKWMTEQHASRKEETHTSTKPPVTIEMLVSQPLMKNINDQNCYLRGTVNSGWNPT